MQVTPRSNAPAAPLFEGTHTRIAAAHVRRRDPAPAQAAANRVAGRIGKQCRALLEILREAGGALSGIELRRRCADRGLCNLTARITDLRTAGYTIKAPRTDRDCYELLAEPSAATTAA